MPTPALSSRTVLQLGNGVLSHLETLHYYQSTSKAHLQVLPGLRERLQLACV